MPEEEPPPEEFTYPPGYIHSIIGTDGSIQAFGNSSNSGSLDGLADGEALQSPSSAIVTQGYQVSVGASEYHVYSTFRTEGSGATTSDRGCYIYVVSEVNYGNMEWTEGAVPEGGPITLNSPTNAVLLGFVSMPQNGTPYTAGPFSLNAAFGGIVPQRPFAFVVENRTGSALENESDWQNYVVAYPSRHVYFDLPTWAQMFFGGGGGGGQESA